MFNLGQKLDILEKPKKEITKAEIMQMLFNLPHKALIKGAKAN